MHKVEPHSHKGWRTIDALKFLYDVSVRPSTHTDSGGRGSSTQ